MTLRTRVWPANTEIMTIGIEASHRSMASFGPIVCMDMGVPHGWGVRGSAGDIVPERDDVAAALAWLRERGAATGWQMVVPSEQVSAPVWSGLVEADRLPLFAMDGHAASHLPLEFPDELDLAMHPSYEDVIAGYGGWMSDEDLARRLVVPSDLQRADRRFIVGSVDGRIVGCAFVWFACGTAYLSGIGVVEDQRGRGYGRALTAAATRTGMRDSTGAEADVIWMAATDEGAALYERMGFERIDEEVALTDASG